MYDLLLSAGVDGLEMSRSDFVPESDSEDGDNGDVDECMTAGLVEETQTYDDSVADDSVFGRSTVAADDSLQQVVLHITQFVSSFVKQLRSKFQGRHFLEICMLKKSTYMSIC